jgi:hypothetical protein
MLVYQLWLQPNLIKREGFHFQDEWMLSSATSPTLEVGYTILLKERRNALEVLTGRDEEKVRIKF